MLSQTMSQKKKLKCFLNSTTQYYFQISERLAKQEWRKKKKFSDTVQSRYFGADGTKPRPD